MTNKQFHTHPQQRILQKAYAWTDQVWKTASDKWVKRKQDFEYRITVTRPALKYQISQILPIQNGTYLDIGCAEGTETKIIYDYLKEAGFTGKLYGVDVRKKTNKQPTIHDLLSLEFKENGTSVAIPPADIIFSQFALQETPSIKEFLNNIHKNLKKEGLFVCIFLHPNFSSSLRKKHASRINKELGSTRDWEYAAEYPIVEETGTFYVPHFQRSLATYKREFKKYFKILRIEELQPNPKELYYKKIQLPFNNDKNNLYYPEILTAPSSILFTVKKHNKKRFAN